MDNHTLGPCVPAPVHSNWIFLPELANQGKVAHGQVFLRGFERNWPVGRDTTGGGEASPPLIGS